LVHADTYRMADAAEVADLDLDESMADSITVVEWGAGLVEALSADRLELVLSRRAERADGADPDDESAAVREVTVTAVGARWAGVDLAAALVP
jgi:tRNA threonylcarbamoyladenosine biosynthesis protein TsaE